MLTQRFKEIFPIRPPVRIAPSQLAKLLDVSASSVTRAVQSGALPQYDIALTPRTKGWHFQTIAPHLPPEFQPSAVSTMYKKEAAA